jgi:meso-butanediol dehydrogenase/(S,S)-butanediol dehydrogenase/diacetyl reductase
MKSYSLTGKAAIVTGAARGIGEAIARELASHGAKTMVADINAEGAAKVARSINDSGGTAIASRIDVTKRETVVDVIQKTYEAFGGLDCMVNNAGIAQAKAYLSLDEADWRRLMDTNGLGVLIGTQEAAKAMIEQGRGGSIVNTASIAGKQGFKEQAHYCASKAAVISLTQSAAKAFGEHKITVNAICPGVVDTEMWNVLGKESHAEGWTKSPDEAFRNGAALAVLGRASVSQDLAGLVRFLASDESRFITGQSIVADGGIIFS